MAFVVKCVQKTDIQLPLQINHACLFNFFFHQSIIFFVVLVCTNWEKQAEKVGLYVAVHTYCSLTSLLTPRPWNRQRYQNLNFLVWLDRMDHVMLDRMDHVMLDRMDHVMLDRMGHVMLKSLPLFKVCLQMY